MVKNLPTVERSTKIRFGKNATEDQGENTIVFNASNVQIDTTQPGSVYITPLRQVLDVSDRQIKILTYNRISKEITDSGVAAVDVLQPNFQATTNLGNTTTNTLEFNNTETSLVTTANVGIANSLASHTLSIGSNLYVDDTGSNVLVVNGDTNIKGDIVIQGNAQIDGVITVIDTENLTIGDAIIELGRNNTVGDTTLDLGLIMNRPGSNVTVGFLEGVDELALAYTETSADSKTITPLTSETLDVHVYGRVLTESNVGIMNTSPIHTLDVGSNLFVDEYGSNVLVVSGNTSISGDLTVDEDTFHVDVGGKSIGLGTVTPDANLHVIGNVYVSSNLTVDENTLHVDAMTNSVGIETKNPQANLHVVGNVYVSSNLTVDENTLHVDTTTHSVGVETKNPKANLHVVGNVYVSSNLTVDEDTLHVDATTNSVGIETKNPQANLHVVGNVYVSSDLTVDEDTLHVDAGDKSIGLGTVNPTSNLHVVGNVYVSSNITTDGTLTLNHPTTALITDLVSNVIVKLDQLSNVVIGEKALANEDMLVYDGSNWTNQLQNHTFLYAKAEEVIGKGDAVYATGTIGNNTFSIRKARADSSATMPALGLAYEAFTLNQEGLIVTFGRADGINTDNFQTGETVYVSNVAAGALSNVKPYGATDLIQNIGLVVKGHQNSGIVSVTGVGRSNDIPNAPIVADETDINYVYVNDTNNDLKKILPTNLLTQLQTLQQVTDTSNKTSNTIQFTDVTTGLVTVGNVEVGGNISISDLIDPQKKYLTMVNQDGFLQKSPVYVDKDTGVYVIEAAEAEFQGNLTLSGNTTILNSESVTISDRIFGVAANNSASQLDSGFLIEHQEGDPLEYANVALIYHADEHRFSLSYTQNTFTDNHILHLDDTDHRMLIDFYGNVEVRHDLIVEENMNVVGTSLLSGDLTVGGASNLFVDVSTSNVGINEGTPLRNLDVNGDMRVQDTTDTASTSGGALVVLGGLGVASNIHSTNVYAASHVGVGTVTTTRPVHVMANGAGGVYINGDGNDARVTLEATGTTADPVTSFTVNGGESFSVGIDNSINDTFNISNHASDVGTNARLTMTPAGITTITNATNATSKTTGALILSGGGLGVAGDIYATNTNFEDVEADSVNVTDATTSDSTTTGALRVAGGVSTQENLNVGGVAKVWDSTAVTGKTDGALVVVGGVGISGDIHATHANLEDVEADSVTVTDSTTSTSTTTGALKVTGGVSTQEKLNVGGITKVWDSTAVTGKTDGALVVVGGVGISGDIHATHANLEDVEADSVTVTDTTVATDKTSGALQVAGGVSTQEKLNVGGITKVWDSTAVTGKTDGALVVVGGVGISGDIHATHANLEDVEADSVTVTDTTVATDKTSGALQVAGGVSTQEKLN